jgi:hypothetical protein
MLAHSARRKTRLFAILPGMLGVAGATGSCETSSLPGTSLGNFSVVGTLKTNTCGSGIGAANPWDFTQALSKDGTTLYMANTDGSDEVSGSLASTSATSATLTMTTTSNVDGNEAGAGTCNLTTATSVALALSSASSPTSFSGTATYNYSVATGLSTSTDCTDQLSSSGGSYATLPCTVTYALAGTRQ